MLPARKLREDRFLSHAEVAEEAPGLFPEAPSGQRWVEQDEKPVQSRGSGWGGRGGRFVS